MTNITAAMAVAGRWNHGADFLCMTTPRTPRPPDEDDIREGTIVTRIAAMQPDLTKEGVQEKARAG